MEFYMLPVFHKANVTSLKYWLNLSLLYRHHQMHLYHLGVFVMKSSVISEKQNVNYFGSQFYTMEPL